MSCFKGLTHVWISVTACQYGVGVYLLLSHCHDQMPIRSGYSFWWCNLPWARRHDSGSVLWLWEQEHKAACSNPARSGNREDAARVRILPIKLSLRNLFILARPRPIKCPVAFQNSTAIQDHARHPVGNTLYLNRIGIIITLLSGPVLLRRIPIPIQYPAPSLLFLDLFQLSLTSYGLNNNGKTSRNKQLCFKLHSILISMIKALIVLIQTWIILCSLYSCYMPYLES